MALAVVLGAFGAHGLKDTLPSNSLSAYKTGIEYHFIHSLSILALGILMHFYSDKKIKWAFYAFSIGILFFSGSLYLLATKSLTGLDWAILGPMTPIGGGFFIIGWLILLFTAYEEKKPNL